MTWNELIAAYLERLAARGRAEETVRRIGQDLFGFGAFCAQLAPSEVELEHLVAYRRELARRMAAGTVTLRLVRVRGLLRWAYRANLLLLDPSRELRLRKVPRNLVRVLTPRELAPLFDQPDPRTVLGLRDLAVLETLYGAGLRRAECLALDLADLDFTEHHLRVRRGKGKRSRVLPLGPHLERVLSAYLERARPELERACVTALFLSQRGRRLSSSVLDDLVRRYARRAGLGRLSPHGLRHAFATHLLEGGAELPHLKALLGHRSLATTEIYTRVRPGELLGLVRRYHPRGRRRGPPLELTLRKQGSGS